MICEHFGECGACIVYENGYESQLSKKLELNKQRFLDFARWYRIDLSLSIK